MEFRASWSKGVRAVTLGVIALLGVVTLLVAQKGDLAPEVRWVVAGVPVATLTVSWLLAPAGYEVSGGEFRARRRLGTVRVPLAALKQVRELPEEDLHHTVRLFANGGLFGIYGWMYSSKLGRHWWYGTRRGNYVLLETKTRKIVVTPDDPEQLVKVLRTAAGLGGK